MNFTTDKFLGHWNHWPSALSWMKCSSLGSVRHICLSEYKFSATQREKNGHFSLATFILNSVLSWEGVPDFSSCFWRCPFPPPFFIFTLFSWKERRVKELLREGRVTSLQKRACVLYFSYSHKQHVFKNHKHLHWT